MLVFVEISEIDHIRDLMSSAKEGASARGSSVFKHHGSFKPILAINGPIIFAFIGSASAI